MILYQKATASEEVIKAVSSFFHFHLGKTKLEQVPDEFYFIEGDYRLEKGDTLEFDKPLFCSGTFEHAGTLVSKNGARLTAKAYSSEGGKRITA